MAELNEKIKRVFSDLRIRCAYKYNMPSFWANSGKDYKVIPTKYAKGYQDALEDAEREITEVLSEQPERCEDTISRKAAIDGFYEMASDTDHLCTVGDYISFLESLPSVQQIDVQEAYYRGKIDGIKECTTRLKKMNDEVAKGDGDESSERTRPI